MKLYKTKLISVCMIIMILLNILFFSINVEASSFSVTASKSSVTVGESFSVTINGAGLTGRYNITGSNVTISGDSTIWIENTSITVTCTATSEGTATVTVTPITVADATTGEDIKGLTSKSINVTVNSNSSSSGGGGTTSKSTEARLSNLGITPNDFKGFKRDTTTYNVEVPNDVSKVNIYAEAVDTKAKISGTGNVNLKEGANTFKITVTAEAGNTKTYTLNITRASTTDNTDDSENEENKSEARLKNLGIKPEEYDFTGFKKDTTSYSVEVPNEVAEIEVYAESVSEKAKVEGTGKVTLNEGLNKIEVKVTAEDGTEMVYTIEVIRVASTTDEEETETNKKLGLSSLIIKDFNLSPKFDSETYEYTLGIKEDLDSLEIEAKANNSQATVEIVGNKNLKEGENIITILVSNAETEEYATYQIIVNKNTQSEVAGIVNWMEPSTWGLREKIIIGVAILLIVVIIVAIIIKIKLTKKEDDDLDLPGADELDRALAEHQELTDEVENETQNEIEQNNNYRTQYEDYTTSSRQEEMTKSDIEKAQEYFEAYTKRRGKHF